MGRIAYTVFLAVVIAAATALVAFCIWNAFEKRSQCEDSCQAKGYDLGEVWVCDTRTKCICADYVEVPCE